MADVAGQELSGEAFGRRGEQEVDNSDLRMARPIDPSEFAGPICKIGINGDPVEESEQPESRLFLSGEHPAEHLGPDGSDAQEARVATSSRRHGAAGAGIITQDSDQDVLKAYRPALHWS